jgi:hypothetical protein
MKLLVTRVALKRYYSAKTVAVFLSAGCVAVFPLILDLFLTALFFPAVIPEPTAGTFAMSETRMWCDLFNTHPLAYIFLYLLLIFLYAGLLSIMSIVLSYIIANRVFIVLASFIVCMFADFILNSLPGYMSQFSPIMFLRPDQPGVVNSTIVIAEFFVLLTTFIIFIFYRARRDEVY